jgi:hypothetical protein
MKSTLPPSKNVEDRTGDTSVYAPHRNPASMRAVSLSRTNEIKAAEERDLQRIKDLGEKNPLRDSLKGMDTEYRKALKHPDKSKPIPIPTERPDPSKPYKRPTVFTSLMDEHGMRPEQDDNQPDDIKGGMKPKKPGA